MKLQRGPLVFLTVITTAVVLLLVMNASLGEKHLKQGQASWRMGRPQF